MFACNCEAKEPAKVARPFSRNTAFNPQGLLAAPDGQGCHVHVPALPEVMLTRLPCARTSWACMCRQLHVLRPCVYVCACWWGVGYICASTTNAGKSPLNSTTVQPARNPFGDWNAEHVIPQPETDVKGNVNTRDSAKHKGNSKIR